MGACGSKPDSSPVDKPKVEVSFQKNIDLNYLFNLCGFDLPPTAVCRVFHQSTLSREANVLPHALLQHSGRNASKRNLILPVSLQEEEEEEEEASSFRSALSH